MAVLTALAKVSSDPKSSARGRRAQSRLTTASYVVSGTGVYLDDAGKISLRLDGASLVQSTAGLKLNPSGSQTIADLVVTTSVTISDAVDIAFGTTTGSMVGASADQKIGFWGVAPVVQPAGAGQQDITLGNTDGEIAAVGFTAANTFTTTTLTFDNLSFSDFYVKSEILSFASACDVLVSDCRNLRDVVASRKTEAESLRAKCEELADDVRNLVTLVRAMRTALIAAGIIKGAA